MFIDFRQSDKCLCHPRERGDLGAGRQDSHFRGNDNNKGNNTGKKFHKRPGNILPLAIIMTMTILLGGIGIGAVVLSGSKESKRTDASVGAYYMADAGVERQLYEIRKNNQPVSFINSLGGTYANGGSWISTGSLEPTLAKTIEMVATSSVGVIDLFDPDNLLSAPGISRVTIAWQPDSNCVNTPSLEASYAYWQLVNGVPELPTDDSYIVLPKDAQGKISIDGLDPSSAYRIRLRAFDCPAYAITAEAEGPNGSVSFPGDVTLAAEGTYNKTTQKIVVTMPKLDVLSGVFDYVLFSECTLVKGAGAQVCPP